ncbi:glycosyltransferase family 4 protein [Egbenema bharatensis]|uniref:glycosyltransferase family 4 protein n=1 Tax=Egbenema bharatensis TaxID=3463334 RepID=UPI003A863CA7
MKTNILVGGSFHASFLAQALLNIHEDFVIYTSAPRNKFGKNSNQYEIKFVPLVASIIQRITKFNLVKLSEQETILFDKMASILMRNCDVLYGWAGFSLISAEKVKKNGGKFILERSCPHVLFQEELLSIEAEKLKIGCTLRSRSWVQRSIDEYTLADFIVVPSSYTYNSFIERGIPSKKLCLVELDRKVTLPPQKYWQPEKKEFVVGMLGGSLLRKGFVYLLEAWNQLNLPNSRLILKASEKELRASPIVSNYLNKIKNLEIISYIKNINEFYQRCDVFCLPSVDEGFGMAAMEALANSLPVIITKNVGARDLIESQDVGFIVEPFNSEEIAEKINLFYENREIIEIMGRKAYQFTLDREAQKLKDGGTYNRKIAKLYSSII